jgi:hypothetical protein
MRVQRTTENGVYVHHLAEAYPQGDVDKIILWRTDRGYFGEITHRKKPAVIPFHEYSSWLQLKRDLMRCLYKELQIPEFDEESQLGPPLLRRAADYVKKGGPSLNGP